MSRLDDELKSMFQRQEPSADFAQRVLARINVEVPPKENFWQRLVSFFQLPTMRWAVAATAILLIAVIGVVQYQRLNQRAIEQHQAGVEKTAPSDNVVANEQTPPPQQQDEGGINNPVNGKPKSGDNQTGITAVSNKKLKPYHQQQLNYQKASSIKNEEAIARQRQGEFAREQLMKALFIASATVNEAKKVAMGGDD